MLDIKCNFVSDLILNWLVIVFFEWLLIWKICKVCELI